MRVLLVSDSYPPLIGGATNAVHTLAIGLTAAGHDVCVATPWQPGTTATEVLDGIEVHRLDGIFSRLWRRFRRHAITYRYTPLPLPDPEVVWRLRRLLRRSRPDVIVSYGWLTYGLSLALTGSDVPLVLSGRDYANVCALRTLLRDNQPCDGPAWGKCLGCASGEYGRVGAAVAVTSVLGQRRRLARKTRGLHSCSHYVQDVLHRHLLEPRATEGLLADVVIPDYRTPEEPGQAVDGLPDEPYVMYVGALRTVKGVDVLLRAYTQLTDPPPLVLIGTRSPDPLPPLPPSAVLIEALPHAQVLRAWQGALFGVAPSLLPEPLGNVIHEAMSAGRPVIGTVPGGQTEMIEDGVNGLLVPSGDVNALAVAMRRLIDDAPLRDRLGQAARTTAERFTEAVQLPRFLALLDQVVDAP